MNLMPPSRPRFAARSLRFLALLGQLAAWQLISTGRQISAVETKVLVEEVVTSYQPANNGAGPLWCYGAPLVVRHNDSVYVSTLETGPDVPPLCNTRWQVWRRTAPLPEPTSPPSPADTSGGWELVSSETDFRQREPCPLVALPGSGLFLSTNASQELIPVDPPGRPVTLTLRFPFSTFFTNTTRGGSAPGPIIDLFGTAHDPANLRYAQIQLRHER